MAIKQFNLPDPGEGLVEADIVMWRIKAGDTVAVNDVVVEIETAKSLVELPIPWAGTVVELLVAEGATVDVGAPIVSVEVAGAEPDPAPVTPTDAQPESGERVANLVGYGAVEGSTTRRARRSASIAAALTGHSADQPAPAAPETTWGRHPELTHHHEPAAPAPAPAPAQVLAKPPVRKFAKDNGIDLAQVTPSRADGVISRADCEAHLTGNPSLGTTTESSPPQQRAAYGAGPRETRTPIKGVRKMTAAAMVGSAFTAPHVTEFITLDMSRTMELVERLKTNREFCEVKVTALLVLAKAVCVAIKRNPQINATWDEAAQEIVVKHYVNLGIAASTPRGLVVPNIKDADRLTMLELGETLGKLVATARDGKTPPADMSGGTITITNVGTFGVDNGTPIINPGEAAILCFGAVRKMPWVVTDAAGNDSIEPRPVTQLSLSFDHRLVDGDLGSRFLADVAALLADPAQALVWG